MTVNLKTVSPNDFDTSRDFMGSPLHKSEKETIARSIVIASQRLGGWKAFTWEEYCKTVDHSPGSAEKGIFDGFVEDGLLELKGKKYKPTDKFIKTLAMFTK